MSALNLLKQEMSVDYFSQKPLFSNVNRKSIITVYASDILCRVIVNRRFCQEIVALLFALTFEESGIPN